MDLTLTTERLRLRPLRQSDAATVQDQCGKWEVVRMLSQVPHPYPDGLAERWIAGHAAWRAEGSAFHFGIEVQDENLDEAERPLIGVITLDRRESDRFEMGYWIGETWWGRGLATEAAQRAVAFAFEELGAARLTADRFDDNPASGRVLAKCGFRDIGPTRIWCESRGHEVQGRQLLIERGDLTAAGAEGFEAAAP